MSLIKKSLSSYPGYKPIAAALSKLIPEPIVAGLIGCIIPESGTNHRILNAKEYKGNGASGTDGWNCGEGLIQWTFWKYKLDLIKKYNADARCTQPLPVTWEEYSKGTPVQQGSSLVAPEDGRHIAGLSLESQMLFLVKYYDSVIQSLWNETDLAVITAKIYQKKAGVGFYSDIKDPVVRAYTTSKNKYPSSAGNHYLQSLKIAQEYASGGADFMNGEDWHAPMLGRPNDPGYFYTPTQSLTNNVSNLAYAGKTNNNIVSGDSDRKSTFLALQSELASNTPALGRSILLSPEMYDSNILKGDQESKKERT